jgi:hypothetical protein
MTHRKLLKGLAFTWLIKDVCVPFGLSLILVMIGWATLYVEGAYLMNLFFGGLLAFIAILVNLFLLHGDIVLKLWRHV